MGIGTVMKRDGVAGGVSGDVLFVGVLLVEVGDRVGVRQVLGGRVGDGGGG